MPYNPHNPPHEITLSTGHAITVTLSRALQGTRAHSMMFAPESADVAATTEETLYMDYCETEILAKEIAKCLPGLPSEFDVWHELESAGFDPCECDDDGAEE